jgi:hypothetical protein
LLSACKTAAKEIVDVQILGSSRLRTVELENVLGAVDNVAVAADGLKIGGLLAQG